MPKENVVERLIRNKSLEELVGQLFMVGFQGTRLNRDLNYFLKKLHMGGIILFKRNVQDPFQLAELNRSLQETAMEIGSIPLFISIDQEGGPVARLGPPFTRFEAQSTMATSEDPEGRIGFFARTQARELKLVGINMDLAPVLDVNARGPEGLMAARSYGDDPNLVARLGALCIRELQQAGIMACAKHFPGIGDTDLDSHQDLPVQLKDRESLERLELIPFRAAIQVPTAAMMISHIQYPDFDRRHPASLSTPIVTGLLRQGLGYEGLVITDDLEMGAVGNHYGIEEAVFLAFAAGVDTLLVCHDPDKIERGYQYLLRKIKSGTVPEELFMKSLKRVLLLKQRFLQNYQPKSEKEIREYFVSLES
jgi:beta-N-acetylhexosaminidase